MAVRGIKKQTLQSLTAYTIEEAYEVVDSIEQNDLGGLQSELGDLLFQVVFYAQLAQEQGLFNFQDVVNTISEKLVRRHPHVFAGKDFADVAAVSANWEAEKAKERQEKDADAISVLDDIPQSLPALMRAAKIQKRCATVGFDWHELPPVIEKIHEELNEVMAEVNQPELDKKHSAKSWATFCLLMLISYAIWASIRRKFCGPAIINLNVVFVHWNKLFSHRDVL